ncbi:MAG: glucose-6-phosphate isomerase, partial [Ignavibacteria bacterium]|nr:glucose-6-phosphate isomerase [Ignavibacteria bacterium]
MLELNINQIYGTVTKDELYSYRQKITDANNMLYQKTGKGSEFLGWLDL